MSIDQESYLSLEEVLEVLGVSRSTGHRWLKEGKLEGYRVGRQWRFPPETIQDFIEARERFVDEAELKEAAKQFAKGRARPRSVEELVRAILDCAQEEGASHLHFSTIKGGVIYRLRARAQLKTVYRFPKAIGGLVLDQLENLADDGEGFEGFEGFEVVVVETTRGKNVVVSLESTPEEESLRLENLMSSTALKLYRKQLSLPWGLHLITGAPGSGRTTLSQACLVEVAGWRSNTVALSDPRSLLPETVVQIPRPRGTAGSELLEIVMSLDPDTVYCDEVEDPETAAELCRIALCGHRVLICMESSGPAEALAHLLEMGLPASLLVQSCRSILAQTLVRALCETCKKERASSKEERKLFEQLGCKRPQRVYQAGVCPQCSHTGYGRRVAAHQVRIPDADLSRAVFRYARDEIGLEELRAVVEEPESARLDRACAELAVQGITSLEEVDWCLQ